MKKCLEKQHRENYCCTFSLALWGCFQFSVCLAIAIVRIFNWVGEIRKSARVHESGAADIDLELGCKRELISDRRANCKHIHTAPSCFQVKLSTSLMAQKAEEWIFVRSVRGPSMEKANTLERQVALTITVIKHLLELIQLKTIIKSVSSGKKSRALRT